MCLFVGLLQSTLPVVAGGSNGSSWLDHRCWWTFQWSMFWPAQGSVPNTSKSRSLLQSATRIPSRDCWVDNFQPYFHLVMLLCQKMMLIRGCVEAVIIILLIVCFKYSSLNKGELLPRRLLLSQPALLHLFLAILSGKPHLHQHCSKFQHRCVNPPPSVVKLYQRMFSKMMVLKLFLTRRTFMQAQVSHRHQQVVIGKCRTWLSKWGRSWLPCLAGLQIHLKMEDNTQAMTGRRLDSAAGLHTWRELFWQRLDTWGSVYVLLKSLHEPKDTVTTSLRYVMQRNTFLFVVFEAPAVCDIFIPYYFSIFKNIL